VAAVAIPHRAADRRTVAEDHRTAVVGRHTAADRTVAAVVAADMEGNTALDRSPA